MLTTSRRQFLGAMGAACTTRMLTAASIAAGEPRTVAQPQMRLGLVTYNWGKDWDLPTLIANCEATGFEGLELRTTHQHGVEIALTRQQRTEVAQRFADSPVTLAGLGTACEYHSSDPMVVQKNVEESKAFIELCHDVGGEGIKVRPNGLPEDVPTEKTLEQIGLALRDLATYGAGYGVEIRLEVHGRGTNQLPHIKTILDVADHQNLYVCWNCNQEDLIGAGLKHNFQLVAENIGTVHIHDLRTDTYPWHDLFVLLHEAQFRGWTLLEDGRVPDDIVGAMRENRPLWLALARPR